MGVEKKSAENGKEKNRETRWTAEWHESREVKNRMDGGERRAAPLWRNLSDRVPGIKGPAGWQGDRLKVNIAIRLFPPTGPSGRATPGRGPSSLLSARATFTKTERASLPKCFYQQTRGPLGVCVGGWWGAFTDGSVRFTSSDHWTLAHNLLKTDFFA